MKHISILLIGLLLLFGSASAVDIKFAIYPMTDPQKLLPPMRILCAYLSEQTGVSVTPMVTRDYSEMLLRLEDRSVDLAWLNPVNYLKLKERLPALRYVATFMEFNQDAGEVIPYYHAYIITRRNSGIHSLADARGTRMAFTDAGSTSGYAYPLIMLRRQGIEAEDYFQRVFFLKRHNRVIEALLADAVDVGAVSDGTFHKAVQQHGPLFQILARSGPIPLDAIVTTGRIPADTLARIQEQLQALPREHAFNQSMAEHLGWPAAGFRVMSDALYDDFRDVLKQAGRD